MIDAVVYNQDTSVAGSERCHRSPRGERGAFFFCFISLTVEHLQSFWPTVPPADPA